jgi:hypothetical protein
MVRRLAALAIALAVAGSGTSPCTAAALARATAAPAAASAPEAHAAHAGHGGRGSAHATHAGTPSGHCAEPAASVNARCACGCTGDLPRAAASAFTAAWALPAPALPRLDAIDAPPPLVRTGRPARPPLSSIDHVPIAA